MSSVLLYFLLISILTCYIKSNGEFNMEVNNNNNKGNDYKLKNCPVKIYIYNIKDISIPNKLKVFFSDVKNDGCPLNLGQFNTEHIIPQLLKDTSCSVENPEDANFFFVPAQPKCIQWVAIRRANIPKIQLDILSDLYYKKILSYIKHKWDFWNRTEGRDHIFLFPSGRGATIFPSWYKYIKNSIFIGPEGYKNVEYWDDCKPYINEWKDIVIPGYVNTKRDILFSTVMKGRGNNRYNGDKYHSLLAWYRGDFDKSDARRNLGILSQQIKKDNKWSRTILITDKKHPTLYKKEITSSTFCFIPKGSSSWTIRYYEAVYIGCIPVIISDGFRFPFEDQINYSKIGIIQYKEDRVDIQLLEHLKELQNNKEYIKNTHKNLELLSKWYNYENGGINNNNISNVGPIRGLIISLQKKILLTKRTPELIYKGEHQQL